MGLPERRELRGSGTNLDGALWITAVTSLKYLSEGFFRGAGLSQCLPWLLRIGPHSLLAREDVGTGRRQVGSSQVLKYD